MAAKKEVRFAQFISQLGAARAATGREDAVALMKSIMITVEDSHCCSDRMEVYSLNAEFGWVDLDVDPCIWNDHMSASNQTHRVYVYNDGRIVIDRVKSPYKRILNKEGAAQRP